MHTHFIRRLGVKGFLSTNSDPILRDVDDYIPDPRDDKDNINRLVEGELDKDEPFTSNTSASLVGSVVSGYSNIVRAYREGRVNGRLVEYLIPDPNFRVGLPALGYLSVYARAFTAGMTLLIHLFVKGLYELHNISPTQLAPNFWYIFVDMWAL